MSSNNNNNNGEIYCFDKTNYCRGNGQVVDEDKETEYLENVALWQRFGLTKELYDATINYNNNLELYNHLCMNRVNSDSVLEEELLAKITAFENDYDVKKAADDLADDENDWWIDKSLVYKEEDNDELRMDYAEHLIDYYRIQSTADDRSKEDDKDNIETEEEWRENYMEQMLEFARQDAIDDYNDF